MTDLPQILIEVLDKTKKIILAITGKVYFHANLGFQANYN